MGKRQKRKRTTDKKAPGKGASRRLRLRLVWLGVATAVIIGMLIAGGSSREGAVTPSRFGFTDAGVQAREFIGYYHSIQLTPQQELVKQRALSRIPAPCCSDNSAYTCCCPCNMAKTWWGLSHYLIAEKDYEAKEVQTALEAWIAFIGPDGFSGNACYTGGCARPFRRNGCGGMSENRIVF